MNKQKINCIYVKETRIDQNEPKLTITDQNRPKWSKMTKIDQNAPKKVHFG